MPERRYVQTELGPTERDSLLPAWQVEPPLWLKLTGSGLLMAVFALVMLPFMSPFRERLGHYVYLHIVLVAAGLLWFFWWLPPPLKATERMRRRFTRCLRGERLRRLGFDRNTLSGTRLVPPDTLEIIMTGEWRVRLYEHRLRDAQNLWRLWAMAYSPDGGFDKALIRLLDSGGREVGGSSPQAGSLIWVEDDRNDLG